MQKGIDLNEKVNNKCATQVGKVRATISTRQTITAETIKDVQLYLGLKNIMMKVIQKRVVQFRFYFGVD